MTTALGIVGAPCLGARYLKALIEFKKIQWLEPGIGVPWSYTITSSCIPVQGRNSVLGYHLTWVMAKPTLEVWEVPFSWRSSSKITNDSPKKSPPKAASVQDPSKSPGSFSSCLEGLIPRQNSSFEPGKGGWHLELSTGMSRICACPGLLDTGADLWQREVMGGRTPSFGEVF